MDDDQKNELKALVVGFLQQNLQENPNGLSVREFERLFPLRADEPHDWFLRYGKQNVTEALECIPDTVRISYDSRYNTKIVSLNKKSEKVDSHLVDLITHQRPSGKRKSHSRPSNRALVSFSLNRQYSNPSRRNNYTTRINHDQQYRDGNFYSKRDSSHDTSSSTPFRPSIYNKQPTSRMASNDPRARASSIVPPQVKLGPPSSYSRSSVPTATTATSSTSNSASPVPKPQPQPPTLPPNTVVPRVKPLKAETAEQKEVSKKEDDPAIVSKKHHIRQRICSLLIRKYPEIKILHLASLYKLEYDESIDSNALGYQHLTFLLKDPLISPYIQINLRSPFPTITLKYGSQTSGKENIGVKSSAINGDAQKSPQPPPSSFRSKLEAIDRFNTKAMTQCLESLGPMKEPPIGNLKIEDQVKYKTMRMIFKDPNLTLRLEDWPKKFDQETKLKIRIRDYGFKTLFEFFKHLALELPITVKLNKQDDWIAVGDMSSFSKWLHDKMDQGKYRAITAMEAYYEMVAFPNDSYRFTTAKDVEGQEYHPAFIVSVKRTNIWIQLRTPQKIEEHLCVEASMTCYEDYKNRDLLVVPKAFVRPGFPCAVFDPTQQRWCRALILKAPDTIVQNCEVTALLVDYAATRTYVMTQLLCLMKRHLDLPVGPIYTRLGGVDDSNLVAASRMKCVLHEYTSPPVTLACKFLRGIPSKEADFLPQICFEVALVDTRSGEDCNLAEDINLPPNSD